MQIPNLFMEKSISLIIDFGFENEGLNNNIHSTRVDKDIKKYMDKTANMLTDSSNQKLLSFAKDQITASKSCFSLKIVNILQFVLDFVNAYSKLDLHQLFNRI